MFEGIKLKSSSLQTRTPMATLFKGIVFLHRKTLWVPSWLKEIIFLHEKLFFLDGIRHHFLTDYSLNQPWNPVQERVPELQRKSVRKM